MTVSLGPSRRIVASAHYKWLAYCAIAIGVFLPVMDQSGVNLAVPRIAGWSARILEYLPDNRLFRPRAVYIGDLESQYTPIAERG